MAGLREAINTDIEGHITYLPDLSTLLDFGGRYVE
jgi:hypothetical protein